MVRNMKVACVFLVGLCALALATPVHKSAQHKVADKVFLQKQKDILRLYKYVNQPSYYKDHQEVAQGYDIQKNGENYLQPQVVKDFFACYGASALPRGQIFSVFQQEQLAQAVALYKLFYYAKDYATFYKTAVWARQNINEGIYVYALSVAVVHREDTQGIVLPPIYEVYPNYFFNSEVIQKVQQYKQTHVQKAAQAADAKGYTVKAAYSGMNLSAEPQQSMEYFTEDVGINAYYYYFNIYYPFWMSKEDTYYKNERRGEQYYFVHQQLLARYYLERLSNNFGQIKNIDYDYPIETSYTPSMSYANGLSFPARPINAHLYNYKDEQSYQQYYNLNYTYANTLVRDYERRIRDAVDVGFVITYAGELVNIYTAEGFETLGNLIEANPQSPHSRFYGALQMFTRYLLGYSYYPLNQYKVAPSALQHFETSLRDPAFYQMYKRIIAYFQQYKTKLPSYQYKDLYYPGLKVEGIVIDELITYFDTFDSDISNAVYVNEQEYETETFQARARQYRLNHKQFTYKIQVTSNEDAEAVIGVFIGPKYDEFGRKININENRMNFVQMDKFLHKFQAGKNTIERNSRDNYYVRDRTTYKQLYQQVLSALEGKQEFVLDGEESFYGFPNRFLLPKGNKAGMTYQIYVIVSPYNAYNAKQNVEYPVSTGYHQYIDRYSLGYPFDRYIEEKEFYVANSYFQDVVIYHKTIDEINKTTKQN